MGHQLDQIVKGAAGEAGQFSELIPQTELERHLLGYTIKITNINTLRKC